jgi:hypothetical protein
MARTRFLRGASWMAGFLLLLPGCGSKAKNPVAPVVAPSWKLEAFGGYLAAGLT